MRLPDDSNYQDNHNSPIFTMMVGTMLFVAIVMGAVLYSNYSKKSRKPVENGIEIQVETEQAELQESATEMGSSTGLRAQDLDFWGMYPPKQEDTPSSSMSEEEKQKKNGIVSETEVDPSQDGKHTLVKLSDGTEEWVLISPYLKKNTYDFTKLVSKSGRMYYYEDGKAISFTGVVLSQYDGDVDFYALKQAGIDFCMCRVGTRGYESGQIILDEKIDQYLNDAKEAGLDTGLYFSSRAITEEEAVEEATVCLQYAIAYETKYPIAYQLDNTDHARARTDALTRDTRTKVASAFCNGITVNSYATLLWGSKAYFMKGVDLSRLSSYPVWLGENGDLPDYPYEFSMWQYTSEAKISGVPETVSLVIAFENYRER